MESQVGGIAPFAPNDLERAALELLALIQRVHCSVEDMQHRWDRGERIPPEDQLRLRERLLRLDGVLAQLEAACADP